MTGSRRVGIGVALGSERGVAVWRAGGAVRTVSVPFQPPHEGDDATGTFAAVFRELASKLGDALGQPVGGARVRLVLLPPLVDVRLVPLPPLRPAETLAVLRRDAARHFVGGPLARVVAVGVRNGGAAVLAAAAPAHLVEAARAAARDAGWRVEAIVPAHAAWLAAGSATGVVVAADGATTHVLRSEQGAPVVLRRVRTASVAEVLDAAGSGPGHALVLAEPDARADLTRALVAAQWTVAEATQTAVECAALNAGTAGLELVPDSLAAERRLRSRRSAARLGVAAVLLALAAAGVELWGAHRELDAVRERRAAIRDEVAPLLAARDSLDRLHERVRQIEALAQAAPRWTGALFDLAMLLPPDAHITSLQASGDTLEVEAAGARAGAALQALRDGGSLRDIRLLGTVQRELEDGSTSVERFRLTARIVPASAADTAGRRARPSPAAALAPGVRDVAARRTP